MSVFYNESVVIYIFLVYLQKLFGICFNYNNFKMKKLTIVFATMAISLSQSVSSQEITLRFTGATADGYYVQLDSVKVQNISRSWSETIVYPDTVLTFSRQVLQRRRALPQNSRLIPTRSTARQTSP